MLNVVMMSVINAQCHMLAFYAECRYAECCYVECRGALLSTLDRLKKGLFWFSEFQKWKEEKF